RTHCSSSCLLSLHDALPIYLEGRACPSPGCGSGLARSRSPRERRSHLRLLPSDDPHGEELGTSSVRVPEREPRPVDLVLGHAYRSEEHTSELQSRENLVCRL